MSFRVAALAACLAFGNGPFIGTVRAAQVCDLQFNDCPGKFTRGTVNVPKSVIWLDAKIPYCNEPVTMTAGNTPPPSIVFIIDNSGSMDENDPDNARFSVVSSLLDDISALAPDAEVGLVIFTRRLSFDYRDNPIFKTAFPGDTTQHDAFVPLMALNKAFANGKTGLDTLQALLGHDSKGNLTYVTQRPDSRNNSGMGRTNVRDGTDISLGFQAGKVAMLDSKATKANQFFIFLSDGTPSTPDDGRAAVINEFISGANTPTTFTVFFDTQHDPPVAPSTIVQMTSNIKRNLYSASNPKSAFWAINTPGTQLQAILQSQVLGNVLSIPTKPKDATLALGEKTYTSTGIDTRNFLFAKHVPLSENTTQVQLNYTYTYIDTTGGKSETKEKFVPYTLMIQRANTQTVPTGLGTSCHEQADISLYNAGQAVNSVTADYDNLEARLTLPSGETCAACKLEVEPSSAKSTDRESLSLAPPAAGGNYLASTFARVTSASPVPGDGILEHLPSDSIVLIYRNPENALDLVRRSFPYTDIQSTLEVFRHNDYSRVPLDTRPATPQWILIAPGDLQVTPQDAQDHWKLQSDPMTPQDSLRYVGVVVEASRGFTVDIKVYTNLAQFVNKVSFAVPQSEFAKLAPGPKHNTRIIKVLWDNRSRNGSVAATGAYVLKTTVTLLRIPGIAEDQPIHSDYRIVGVLRGAR